VHLGNARIALTNYVCARQQQGAFILRIDDTDTSRNELGSEEGIMADLKWLGLEWTEGPDVGGSVEPYRQSERMGRYDNYIGQLLGDGHAYRCFCTPAELQGERDAARAKGRPPRYSGKCADISESDSEERASKGEPHCLRFRMPLRRVIVTDLAKGEITFNLGDIGDFVLTRTDGKPTYNFASALDDGLMQITHVIRGEDHVSNTPRQIVLMEALKQFDFLFLIQYRNLLHRVDIRLQAP